MVKKFLLILCFLLLAASCNKPVIRNEEAKSVQPIVASSTEKMQAEEIANLKNEIEALKNQPKPEPQIVTKVVKEPAKEDSALKIEKCKDKWHGNSFPGTKEEFINIHEEARKAVNYVVGELNGTMNYNDTIKTFEEIFRQDGYKQCLNN